MKAVLTIAGSDCSGGAGIQADLKTFLMHRVYGMSAITALTAQNTTGVYGVTETEPTVLASQLDCVFQDIFPDAVKIGMMPSVQAVQVTAQKLRQYRPAHIVLDPVMVSTSGRWLMSTQAVAAIQQELFPLAEVLTPNLPEAEALIGRPITSRAETEAVAAELSQRYGCAMRTTCCGRRDKGCGFQGGKWKIQTPTVPAAPCPAPSQPTWQTVWSCLKR